MKTKLLALILGAALVGSSTAALAERERGGRHDRPRAEHRYERDYDRAEWRRDRVHARSDRYDRGHRRDPHWARGHGHGKHWKKGHRHGKHWKKSHRHGRHWAKKHRRHDHYYARPAHPHRYHGKRHHRPYYEPFNSLSIILHGHF